MKARVDEVDRVIITELSRNARATFKELAKAVNLTDVAAMKRVRKLEKMGVIKKYTVIVDPKALGYEYVSFTGINVKPEKLFHVAEELKKREDVKYLAITGGDHDILAVIWTTTRELLEKIHREIEQLDGVVAVYPMILTTVIKDEFYI
jgi:Lrp/AsnC family transcriptional regulator for asnA, asnC and gidA